MSHTCAFDRKQSLAHWAAAQKPALVRDLLMADQPNEALVEIERQEMDCTVYEYQYLRRVQRERGRYSWQTIAGTQLRIPKEWAAHMRPEVYRRVLAKAQCEAIESVRTRVAESRG